jgi:alpha-tubulin suppressor-like RCC1 family protein
VKTFRVIVEDRTPPVLADHADVTTLTSSTTGVLRYTKPTATDAVDPNPGVSCTPEAGTAVALGQTTVTCVATDASGNPSAAKAFNVLVRAVAPPPPVSAGGWFMCRLTDAATVECWGVNNNAELGDGTTIDRSTPVAVSELSGGVSAISTGGSHTCALLKTGGVECWGYNAYGQLGDGTTGNRSRAVAVSGLSSGVLAISAGAVHTCAILDGGAVTCWGANFYGTLGDGTKTGRITPVPVSGLGGAAVGIAAGGDHTCALLDDGGVKCWGRNSYGQIGDGTQTDKLIPTAVSGLSTGAVAVVAGGSHTCALLNGGGVKCWGSNNRGSLGDGTRNPSLTPVAVSGLSSGVIAIDAGPHAESEHTCAVTTGGTAMCWGSNRFGQLGTGTDLGQPLTPVAVSGLSGSVSAVTAGMFYSCALLSNGSLQCWGSNYYGQLGDGTTIARLTPVYVLGVPLSADVSAGGTLSTGIEATADQPLQVSVTTPNPGPVSIELSVTTDTVWNYRLFDRQTIVHAPDATPGSPLQLTFRLDATLVGASDPAEIDVFRDGVAVAGCGGSIGAAVPDPCLASRTTLADGDLQFAVYTSHASQWNFGVMLDSTPPTLSLPGDIRVEATSAAGAVVDYPMPFATDDIDPNPTVSCTPASGSVFAIGTTIVWCSAQDAVGNAASANFTVTVQDTTVPVISSVPVNQTLEATGPAGAVATWTAPTASDLVDGAVSVTCAPAAGATVAVGTTTVTCTATDAQGNGASVSFTVTVQDTTAPVLTLPSGITVDASSPAGATVAFAAAAVDLVDGSVGVSCTPSAGSVFAVGTTMVACSAADAHGNRVSAGFSVTVRSPAEMTENLSRLAVAYGMPQSDKLLASVVRHATGSGSSLVAACNDLRAFMNQTRAQAGKRLTADQANALTSDALRVQSALGCR